MTKNILVVLLGFNLFTQKILSIAEVDQTFISKSIAMAYLSARKSYCQKRPYIHENRSVHEKIFGKEYPESVEMHDATIKIEKKTYDNKLHVVITTKICGAPEDFEFCNVLSNERKLLKYLLITAYLKQCKSKQSFWAWLKGDHSIDNHTHVTVTPVELSHYNFFTRTNIIITDRRTMTLTTTFSIAEFEELIQKYFV